MDFEEFKQKIFAINVDADRKRKAVAKEYADSNNKIQIGDIATDHVGSVLVEDIEYRLYNSKPDCIYYGLELKKNGEPKKRESRRHVFQCNLILATSNNTNPLHCKNPSG